LPLVDYSAAGDGVWAGGFWLPGNATQEMSFAQKQLIKQGAKRVMGAEDPMEELPTPVRATLLQAEAVGTEQRTCSRKTG
jgi:predicted Rossmann fold nucleotide-binding protein DprA/Smf involved in DNA uptake